MTHEKGDDVASRRRVGPGTGSGGTEGRRRWSRSDFLRAAGLATGLVSLGAVASVVGAQGNGTAQGGAPPAGAPGKKRAFAYRGKKVEIAEDDRGRFADVTIDGKGAVRAKRVGKMYRAPDFAFVPAHTPDELARFIIDYRLALAADAAGTTVVGVTVPDGVHHDAAGGH